MDVYEAIYSRRDVRCFRPKSVPDGVLVRILDAAHHAGSVGFMQPWNFLVIRTSQVKQKVVKLFERANTRAASRYSGPRREFYDSLKVQGILESPVNLAVTCDRQRKGPAVLGRDSMRETDLYSTCCAIQNLWLAARAEGIGIGWVSILEPEAVKEALSIPREIVLVAYLCLGYPVRFEARPMLETAGWETRISLDELVFEDSWNQRCTSLFE